ncbi:hypothetical protein ES705_10500 [subsurface metagenome]
MAQLQAGYPHDPPGGLYPASWWWPLFGWRELDEEHYYLLQKPGADNLADEIHEFFSNAYAWVRKPWDALFDNVKDVAKWVADFWTAMIDGLVDFMGTITSGVGSLYTLVANFITLLWWELISDVTNYVKHIFKPLTDAWNFLTDTLVEWFKKIWEEIKEIWDDPIKWALEQAGYLWEHMKALGATLWDAIVPTIELARLWIGDKISYLAPQITEYLRDVLFWIWEHIKEAYYFVKEQIAPAVWDATSGAVGWLKDQFTHLIGLAYDEITGYAKTFAPMTPGKAPELAGIMFASAAGFGALAHGIALGVEMVPNLKYMGVHYLSGFLGSMAGFGAVTAATMGVIAALAVRLPFTYYMNRILRPTIPDEKLLIEFRSKREFGFPEFKQYMSYHGFPDEWIAKIDSWLWKDPRLFEILYCADVTVPPKEWLVRKFERAGYEDIDIDVLCKVVERRTTQSPRTYYTTSLRRNFRHGFLTEGELVEGIKALEMAPEAIDWIKRTGELDNIYEVNSDWVTTYKTAYRNDLITEDELRASLSAMGLPKESVTAIIELEWVRKQPRVLAAERKEIETQWREIQAEYSRVYIESFRRGLSTEDQLAAYLAAIGINDKVAMATARHEAIKLVPKPKPEAIQIPVIPVPPEPPTYKD